MSPSTARPARQPGPLPGRADVFQISKARYADTVYLSVGLHNGFGAAQRIYIKRGYIPDGSGIWYRDKPCVPYEDAYPIDDELVLYLSKKLK